MNACTAAWNQRPSTVKRSPLARRVHDTVDLYEGKQQFARGSLQHTQQRRSFAAYMQYPVPVGSYGRFDSGVSAPVSQLQLPIGAWVTRVRMRHS